MQPVKNHRVVCQPGWATMPPDTPSITALESAENEGWPTAERLLRSASVAPGLRQNERRRRPRQRAATS